MLAQILGVSYPRRMQFKITSYSRNKAQLKPFCVPSFSTALSKLDQEASFSPQSSVAGGKKIQCPSNCPVIKSQDANALKLCPSILQVEERAACISEIWREEDVFEEILRERGGYCLRKTYFQIKSVALTPRWLACQRRWGNRGRAHRWLLSEICSTGKCRHSLPPSSVYPHCRCWQIAAVKALIAYLEGCVVKQWVASICIVNLSINLVLILVLQFG